MEKEEKKIIFSGIQPSGALTIGNYIGALRNFGKLTAEYDCYYCVVDLHAITVAQKPEELRKNTLSLLALYLACGLDPAACTLFLQSHVPAHAELAWVLECCTYYGEAKRMTQFKDKSKKNPDNVNMGLLNYPILMAADILLYRTDLVPVGIDQKQHLELARDLSMRFNARYSPTFTVPEPYIPKTGAKITSLQDPLQKMSKSDDNENGYVSLLDAPETILRKFRRAVTDSESVVRADKTKPGVTNLLTIYAAFTGRTIAEAESDFASAGYGVLKERTAEAVIAGLAPIQSEYTRLMADTEYLKSVLTAGAEKARYAARRTLSKVYKKIGFIL